MQPADRSDPCLKYIYLSKISTLFITEVAICPMSPLLSSSSLWIGDKTKKMNTIDEVLIDTARMNNVVEVLRLLSVEADVNAKERFGETPLIVASMWSHSHVVHELMDHGADTESEKCTGRTRPLNWACCNGHLAVVTELLNPIDSIGTTTSILGKRKSRGAAIDPKDRNGNTPLHWASRNGYLAVVKALLIGGADILAVNDQGGHRNSAVTKCLLQQPTPSLRALGRPYYLDRKYRQK
jgi:ankyrin repeat protein